MKASRGHIKAVKENASIGGLDKMAKTNTARDYVSKRFSELYRQKWRGQGKTATQFVAAIKEVMPEALCDYKYVSKWLNGYMSPVKYLRAICEVLEVDISEFTPKKHADRYEYSPDYADGLEGWLEERAVNNFKIDLTFFQGLRNIIPNFDEIFPNFCPIYYRDCDSQEQYYKRMVPAAASEASKGKALFQLERDGTTFFLTKNDMKFIKEMQIRVKKLMIALFEAHKKELEAAEANALAMFWEKNMEINPNFAEDNTFWETYVLSDEELQQIDRYGLYTDAEKKRYHLPPDDHYTDEKTVYPDRETED